jgi:DNA (cytosine-5)-methyltransferase 1
MGYYGVGFDIVGVDIKPQPHYPFPFVQADIMDLLSDSDWWEGYDAIHASPPRQHYSTATWDSSSHPDLVPDVKKALEQLPIPYVIENVPQAPLRCDLILCGSMFNLKVRRHRIFQSNVQLDQPCCRHAEQGQPWGVYGDGGGTSIARVGGGSRGRKAHQSDWAELMGMYWATPQEIKEAIPPVSPLSTLSTSASSYYASPEFSPMDGEPDDSGQGLTDQRD